MECKITPKVGVVIVAGGKGARMGSSIPKQFMILDQAPILVHTISRFTSAIKSLEVVVVLPAEYIEYWHNLSSRFEVGRHIVVEGGSERFHSVKRGIESLSEDCEIIAIQDGVRPLCTTELIESLLDEAIRFGSAVPAIEISDSIRVVDGQESKIVDRSTLRAIQTPQIFDSALLRRAYRQEFSPLFTDDASVVEASGERVHLCKGDKHNIKITTNEDLDYAEMILTRIKDGAEESIQIQD